MRRRRLITAAFVITAGALGAGGQPPLVHARAADCRTTGRTVAANAVTRVYVRVIDGGQVRRYAACDVARRRARSIGVWESGMGGISPHFGLQGRNVLFEDILCVDRSESCTGLVGVLDVRTNRVRVVAQYPGPPEAPPATGLLLAPKGTVVWIRPGGSGSIVEKVEPGGGPVELLDPGPDVDPGSLALAGSRFYWLRGGVTQTFLAR